MVVELAATRIMLLMLVVVFHTKESSSSAIIAKPGCQDTCGNVSIPYPFGIGPDCYAYVVYNITCDNSSTPPRPIIHFIGLELLNVISVSEATFRVLSPIVTSNCPNRPNRLAATLHRTPFQFSEKHTRFTAMGCNIHALMYSREHTVIGDCYSYCDLTRNTGCNGTNCCQIRFGLTQQMNATLESIDSGNKNNQTCTYAFMVDQEWFNNLTDPNTVKGLENVPVVVEWRTYGVCNTFGIDQVGSGSPLCGANAQCYNQTPGYVRQSFRCGCDHGYAGNPYLPNGCQDIDECANPKDNNCGQMLCMNTPGNYSCYCPSGYIAGGSICYKMSIKNRTIVIDGTVKAIKQSSLYMSTNNTRIMISDSLDLFSIHRGHGSMVHGRRWYEELSDEVRTLVDNAGFGLFALLLEKSSNDRTHIQALVERWWDTTNTFHMLFGEMIKTLLDFAMITGIPFGGFPVARYDDLQTRHEEIIDLLGAHPGEFIVPAKWFLDTFKGQAFTNDQMARAYIMYVLGCSLMSTKGDRINLGYLASLADIDRISQYNWEGAGPATLYNHISEVSRGNSPSIGGYWRAWVIWSHEYLRMRAPSTRDGEADIMPQGLKWRRGATGWKVGAHDFIGYKNLLTNLREVHVVWNPWEAALPEASKEIQVVVGFSRMRILLVEEACREWYLGERVTRQSLATPAFYVPRAPPATMRSTETLDHEDLVTALGGGNIANYLDGPDGYPNFRLNSLMHNFHLMDVTRPVPGVADPPALP